MGNVSDDVREHKESSTILLSGLDFHEFVGHGITFMATRINIRIFDVDIST
jgi:hypothetical protein